MLLTVQALCDNSVFGRSLHAIDESFDSDPGLDDHAQPTLHALATMRQPTMTAPCEKNQGRGNEMTGGLHLQLPVCLLVSSKNVLSSGILPGA